MPAIPFQRLYDEIEAIYKPPRRRKATWFKMRTVMQEFQALPGVRKSSDLTPLTICRWVEAHQDRRAITNRSYLNSFRVVCRYASKMHYLKTDPWTIRTDWVPEDEQDEEEDQETTAARHCTIEQILRFLNVLDDGAQSGEWKSLRLQALGYTYAYTGMRKMEALGLRVEDVSLIPNHSVIRVKSRRKRKLKNRASARLVGIAGELKRVLENWMPASGSVWLFPGVRRGVPWFHGTVGTKALDELKEAGKQAGIDNLTIHGLRRSLATHARRMGLGLEDAQHILGHATVQTTKEWYLEPDAANSAALGERISYRALLPDQAVNPN